MSHNLHRKSQTGRNKTVVIIFFVFYPGSETDFHSIASLYIKKVNSANTVIHMTKTIRIALACRVKQA